MTNCKICNNELRLSINGVLICPTEQCVKCKSCYGFCECSKRRWKECAFCICLIPIDIDNCKKCCSNCKGPCKYIDGFFGKYFPSTTCMRNCDLDCNCTIKCGYCEDTVKYCDFVNGKATNHTYYQGSIVQHSGDVPICNACSERWCWAQEGPCSEPCTNCNLQCDAECGCICLICKTQTKRGGCNCYENKYCDECKGSCNNICTICNNNCDTYCECLIKCEFCDNTLKHWNFIHDLDYQCPIYGSKDVPRCSDCFASDCMECEGPCANPCKDCGGICTDCHCLCPDCRTCSKPGGCKCYDLNIKKEKHGEEAKAKEAKAKEAKAKEAKENNRNMTKRFKNGQQIRHKLKNSMRIGTYNSETNTIVFNKISFNTLSGFAKAHLASVGNERTVNGWKECEYKEGDDWVSTF